MNKLHFSTFEVDITNFVTLCLLIISRRIYQLYIPCCVHQSYKIMFVNYVLSYLLIMLHRVYHLTIRELKKI